jgi:hypothetical protein
MSSHAFSVSPNLVTCRRLTEKAISGIELARKVKKGQFNLQCLRKRAGDVHDLWVTTIMA